MPNGSVASFLHPSLQHLEWVKQDNSKRNDNEFAPKYDFNPKNIKMCKPRAGTKFLPRQLTSFNCGLCAMLICESCMRGIVPSMENNLFESICKNCHLISSLATGVCLLGNCSVHSILHSTVTQEVQRMQEFQKSMFEILSD